MFSRNLKFYRLRKQMSKKELAERVHMTPMAITHYEKGDRRPDMEILRALASALEVRVYDFLAVRNEDIVFEHGEFRKNSALSNTQQEYIRECAEEYFSRFMTVVEVLGGDVLPDAPVCHILPLLENPEKNALALREHLGFPKDGPIEDLIGKLENKGILVYECSIDSDRFSGMNGFVNNRPFIVLNSGITPERNRSTAAHELAHLMFRWPENMDNKEIETMAAAVGGAFLFPESDAKRELGFRRSAVAGDMIYAVKEYGISMNLLVKRAKACHIITSSAERDFCIKASKAGWKKNEPSRIEAEKPLLFEQLVCRAVSEEEISVQRGAELLNVPYERFPAMSLFD